jgi:hypothetical protein
LIQKVESEEDRADPGGDFRNVHRDFSLVHEMEGLNGSAPGAYLGHFRNGARLFIVVSR